MTLSPIRPASAGYKVNWVKAKKVQCTVVQPLRLCRGCTAKRGSRGIALLFLDYGTRREWGVSVTPRPLFTLGKDLVPIVQEAGWGPGPVWTGAENLAPTGIRSPDYPACSQLLYRLHYPAHWIKVVLDKFVWWENYEFQNKWCKTEWKVNFWWTKRYVILSLEAGLVSEMRVWFIC